MLRLFCLLLLLCGHSLSALAADTNEDELRMPPVALTEKAGAATPAPDKPADAKPPASLPLPAVTPDYNTIVLQGLNKVTARISRLEAPLGTVMRFGNLEIIARRCWKSAPEDQPENAALLEVWELRPGESPQRIFLGWMFSSSPGLSALEHPVYDITVLGCEARKEVEKTP